MSQKLSEILKKKSAEKEVAPEIVEHIVDLNVQFDSKDFRKKRDRRAAIKKILESAIDDY